MVWHEHLAHDSMADSVLLEERETQDKAVGIISWKLMPR